MKSAKCNEQGKWSLHVRFKKIRLFLARSRYGGGKEVPCRIYGRRYDLTLKIDRYIAHVCKQFCRISGIFESNMRLHNDRDSRAREEWWIRRWTPFALKRQGLEALDNHSSWYRYKVQSASHNIYQKRQGVENEATVSWPLGSKAE